MQVGNNSSRDRRSVETRSRPLLCGSSWTLTGRAWYMFWIGTTSEGRTMTGVPGFLTNSSAS